MARKAKAKAAAPAAASAHVDPAAEDAAPVATIDVNDLTQIKGIGPAMSKRLKEQGIASISDLAALAHDDTRANDIDEAIASRGQMESDNWIGQAVKILNDIEAGEAVAVEGNSPPIDEEPPFALPPEDETPPEPREQPHVEPTVWPRAGAPMQDDEDDDEEDEPAPKGVERAILDPNKKKSSIHPSLKGATWYQDGLYFGNDGVQIFVDDDDLEKRVPKPGNAPPISTDGELDLAGWATGRVQIPFSTVARAIRGRWAKNISAPHDAVDFLVVQGIVTREEVDG